MYHTMSSGVIAMRRGRAAGSGKGYSVISKVSGSIRPILLLLNSSKKSSPFEFITIP